MFGHLPEFFLILVIGLIVFGPERLPEVARNAGKMVRELRDALDVSMHPQDVEVPADFSTYYYESMQRSGEDMAFEEPIFGEEESAELRFEPGDDEWDEPGEEIWVDEADPVAEVHRVPDEP